MILETSEYKVHS